MDGSKSLERPLKSLGVPLELNVCVCSMTLDRLSSTFLYHLNECQFLEKGLCIRLQCSRILCEFDTVRYKKIYIFSLYEKSLR
jgi:hypothetical protein